MRWLLRIGVGALLGAGAALTTLVLMPWGALGADQHAAFWGLHLVLGAALLSTVDGLLGDGIVRRFPHGRQAAWPATLATTAVLLAALAAGNRKPMPPVLLVFSDTTRADHLSVYGYERATTPFLEELAERSVVFDDALSQGSHTIVSTPALLMSCYPSEHGLDSYHDVLPEEHVLVSEIFEEHGYYTVGVVTNPHLSGKNGFDQGFASYDLLGLGNREAVFAERVRALVEQNLDGGWPVWVEEDRENRAKAPFFGFVFYTDPHAPYVTPPAWRRRFVPEGVPEESLVFEWDGDRSPRRARRLIDQYDATIAYWDTELRFLSESLDARGLWRDALLIYTSDHGEEFLEHGRTGHGDTLFEESVHVPLVMSFPVPVRWPPLHRTKRRVGGAVGGIDVMPTVLDYLRLPPLPGASGTSQLDAALGRKQIDPDRPVILEQRLDQLEKRDIEAVRTTRHKFIRGGVEDGIRPPYEYFFDLAADPGETRDVLGDHPERAERFRALLDEHHERVGRKPAPEVRRMTPDEEHLRQLRALGYID